MKPWPETMQEGLKELLDFYRNMYKATKISFEGCPLCRNAKKYLLEKGKYGEMLICEICPWTVMTGAGCGNRVYKQSGGFVVVPATLRAFIYGVNHPDTSATDKEMLEFIGQRADEIEQWIKYWEEQ